MTHLQQELKKRNISTYKILKHLKTKNVAGSHTSLSRKISGESPITKDHLIRICEVVTEISGQKLNPEDLKSELAVYTLRMK